MSGPGGEGDGALPGAGRFGDGSATATIAAWLPLWAWPAVATIAVAVTSQVVSAWWAAVLVALFVVVAATILLSMRPSRSPLWSVATALIGGVLAVGALVFGKTHINNLASPGAAEPPSFIAGQSLRGKDLSGAELSKQSLARTDLRGADLAGANLSGTDLSNASLQGADLRGADLHDACLRRADLTGANLAGADFTGADVREAIIRPPGDAIPATWPPTPSSAVNCQG